MKIIFSSPTVQVIESTDERGETLRQLYLGPSFNSSQGGYRPARPHEHLQIFTRNLTLGALSAFGNTGLQRGLFLGLGAGIVVQAVRDLNPQIELDIVDLSLDVFDASNLHFFNIDAPNIQCHQADALEFVKNLQQRGVSYDFICCDIWGHSLQMPDYILSADFMGQVSRHLRHGGVYAINAHFQMHKALSEALTRQFRHVVSWSGNNATFMCSDATPHFDLSADLMQQQLRNQLDVDASLRSSVWMQAHRSRGEEEAKGTDHLSPF